MNLSGGSLSCLSPLSCLDVIIWAFLLLLGSKILFLVLVSMQAVWSYRFPLDCFVVLAYRTNAKFQLNPPSVAH
jgi:hypothetical protein